MRFLYPPDKTRKEITARLKQFFKTEEIEFFNAAVNLFCAFYEIEKPKYDWYERLDDNKTADQTAANGTIDLIWPSSWKAHRKYRSWRRWIEVFYHEHFHVMFWVDEEVKAEMFAQGFLKR